MRDQVANRPKRLHILLKTDIEQLNMQKYNGNIPFTKASYEYALEKRKLEEQNRALQKKLEELTQNKIRRSLL